MAICLYTHILYIFSYIRRKYIHICTICSMLSKTGKNLENQGGSERNRCIENICSISVPHAVPTPTEEAPVQTSQVPSQISSISLKGISGYSISEHLNCISNLISPNLCKTVTILFEMDFGKLNPIAETAFSAEFIFSATSFHSSNDNFLICIPSRSYGL